jgi:hypothetical protein
LTLIFSPQEAQNLVWSAVKWNPQLGQNSISFLTFSPQDSQNLVCLTTNWNPQLGHSFASASTSVPQFWQNFVSLSGTSSFISGSFAPQFLQKLA